MRNAICIALIVLLMGCYRSDQNIELDYNAFDLEYVGEDVFELISTFSFTQVINISGSDVEVPSASHKFRVNHELLLIGSVPYQIQVSPTSLPTTDTSPDGTMVLNRYNLVGLSVLISNFFIKIYYK